MRTGIALGSNLGDRLQNLRAGRDAVLRLPGVTPPWLFSTIYETPPVDCRPGTPAYLNAVLEMNYEENPITLLKDLLAIEQHLGRPAQRPRNVSRSIDLDLLYCGEVSMQTDEVSIPHPRLHLRRFVLEPLAGIAPQLILPNQTLTIAEMLAALPGDPGVYPLEISL